MQADQIPWQSLSTTIEGLANHITATFFWAVLLEWEKPCWFFCNHFSLSLTAAEGISSPSCLLMRRAVHPIHFTHLPISIILISVCPLPLSSLSPFRLSVANPLRLLMSVVSLCKEKCVWYACVTQTPPPTPTPLPLWCCSYWRCTIVTKLQLRGDLSSQVSNGFSLFHLFYSESRRDTSFLVSTSHVVCTFQY